MGNKFQKSERIKSKVTIQNLFESSKNYIINDIKVYWNEFDSDDPEIKVLISVPKQFICKACDRNIIKRYLRESYRNNKHILSLNKKSLNIALCYLSKEMLKYAEIEEKIKLILQRLKNKI